MHEEDENAAVIGPTKSKLASLLALSASLGGASMLSNLLRGENEPIRRQQPEPHTGEFNLEKIDPKEAYLGAVYDTDTGRWYACVMQFNAEDQSGEGKGWKSMAKCRYGFDTPMEAKLDAAKQFPLVPVISDDGAEFSYPSYGKDIEFKAKILREAEEKRLEKAARRAARMEKHPAVDKVIRFVGAKPSAKRRNKR